MNEPSLIIVVVEDEHHRMLIYKYLKKRGFGGHAIRIFLSPSASGSAEKWVRNRFVLETCVYRKRQAQTALIVVIDADLHTVQDRLAQLDRALAREGRPVIDGRERVARLVPKRNVETWILCLNGQVVDEETDYKWAERDWNQLITHAARTLSRLASSPANLADGYIDSLRHCLIALKRLDL